MLDLPLVYLAAPYTKGDPVSNTHEVCRQASRLVDTGLLVPVIPHLNLLWHAIEPRPVDFWYAYDLALLERCDAMLRLPGESPGADAEEDHASVSSIPVFHDVPALLGWAAAWAVS